MTRFDDTWLAHQRKRWMRPDAYRWVRPDAYRFMPPGSPRYDGKDAVKYFWPEAETGDFARYGNAEAAELQHELDDIRRDFEALKRAWRAQKAGFNPSQQRVPAGNPDGGQWTNAEGTRNDNGENVDDSDEGADENNDSFPPLRNLHPDSTYETDRNAKQSLEYWRKQSTDHIVESLKPGNKESLRVYPDGGVANGNTRIRILREREYDVNSLPREPYSPRPSGPRGGGGGLGGSGGGGLPRLWPWQ